MPDQPEAPATPWPDWLDDLTPEDRVRAIADAVAECYGDHQCQGKADHFRESAGGQHCTVGVAGDLLLRLLAEARQQAPASPDPYPLPGSGVTLWRSVSSFEAVQITEGCDLDAIAEWCAGTRSRVDFGDGTGTDGVRLLTRHGHVTATEGDWISMDGTPPTVWAPSAFPQRFEPPAPESGSVIVSRDDLRAVLAAAWAYQGDPAAFNRCAAAAGLLDPPEASTGPTVPA